MRHLTFKQNFERRGTRFMIQSFWSRFRFSPESSTLSRANVNGAR